MALIQHYKHPSICESVEFAIYLMLGQHLYRKKHVKKSEGGTKSRYIPLNHEKLEKLALFVHCLYVV